MMGLLCCTFVEMRSLCNDLEVVQVEVAGLCHQLGNDQSFQNGVVQEYMAALIDGDEGSESEEEDKMEEDAEFQLETNIKMVLE